MQQAMGQRLPIRGEAQQYSLEIAQQSPGAAKSEPGDAHPGVRSHACMGSCVAAASCLVLACARPLTMVDDGAEHASPPKYAGSRSTIEHVLRVLRGAFGGPFRGSSAVMGPGDCSAACLATSHLHAQAPPLHGNQPLIQLVCPTRSHQLQTHSS